MKPAARIGDDTLHGGKITSGAATVLISSRSSARVGDAHDCPQHGPGVIVQGSATVIVANSFASRLGDLCGCAGAGFGGTGGGAGSGAGGAGGGGGTGDDDPLRYDGKYEKTPDGEYRLRSGARGKGLGEWDESELGPVKYREKLEAGEVDIRVNPDKATEPGAGLPLKVKGTGSKKTKEIEFLGMKFGKETTVLEAEAEVRDDPGKDKDGVSIVRKGGLSAYEEKLYLEGGWDIRGYKIRMQDEVSAGIGEGLPGGELEVTRDKKDGTWQFGGGGSLEFPNLPGLGLKKVITITPPGAGGAEGAGAGLPNVITSGDATVLIG